MRVGSPSSSGCIMARIIAVVREREELTTLLEDTKLHCQLATYRVPRWDSSMKNDRLVAMAHHRLVMQSN